MRCYSLYINTLSHLGFFPIPNVISRTFGKDASNIVYWKISRSKYKRAHGGLVVTPSISTPVTGVRSPNKPSALSGNCVCSRPYATRHWGSRCEEMGRSPCNDPGALGACSVSANGGRYVVFSGFHPAIVQDPKGATVSSTKSPASGILKYA